MNKFQYLSQDFDRIKKETKMGLISTCILSQYAMYSRFDYYRKLGNNVTISAIYTAETMRVSKRCVFRAIKNMQEEI
jgi:hypothetical protein